MSGSPGSGAMRRLRGNGPEGKKTPELMDPSRQRDGRRIMSLFKPYKLRLAIVLFLIVLSAGASMINPFLIRAALDTGLLEHNSAVLTATVLGMIGIALFSAATSVWQTYMSNVVGQQVMHDLRAAVYQHLQRMSLAFFTRTRTGEVQSRIANDIGGLDSVLTTTATTIAQNATTVIAALAAMLILDWQLALLSLAFVPPSVWGTRKVGKIRRRITTRAAAPARGHVGAGRGVAVGVGDHARQDDGPRRRPRRPVHRRVEGHRRRRGPLANGRTLDDGDDPVHVRGPAGADLLARGAELRRHVDLDRHRGRVHDASDPAAVPDPVAARRAGRHGGVAGAVRPHLRVPRPADRHRRGRASRSSCGPSEVLGEVQLRGRVVPLRRATGPT